jgi:hypothetical protein
MKIDIKQAAKELREKGYFQTTLFDDPSDLVEIEKELKEMKAEHYTPSNLENHSVYLSDKTETRESHAMMVSRGRSDLPTVPILGSRVQRLLEFHDAVLGEIVGKPVPPSSRSMLNFQEYQSGSKPVAEHYDGEYLKYDKLSPTEFKLKEGLLPRYVMVFTVRNENVGEEVEGTVIRDIPTGEVINTKSRPGMLLIFDNIRFRHAVPELKKPRLMCGLRNFDFEPAHFSTDLSLFGATVASASEIGVDYLSDLNNPGFVKLIPSEEARQRQLLYVANEWPKHWEEIRRQGAVF